MAGFCSHCCCLVATTEIEPNYHAAYSGFPPKYRAGRKSIIQKNVLVVHLTFFSSKNIKHSVFSVVTMTKEILIILFFNERLSVIDCMLIVQENRIPKSQKNYNRTCIGLFDNMGLELQIHYALVQKDLLQIKSPEIYVIQPLSSY